MASKTHLTERGRAPTESELLTMLPQLAEVFERIEKDHREAESTDLNHADVSRIAMYDSLEAAINFLNMLNIRSRPLHRLLTALDALIYGSKVPPEFRLSGIARPDAPAVLAIRGTLAGLAAALYRFGQVKPSERANTELTKRLSSDLGLRVSRRQGKISARMISDWRAEYGGRYGEPGLARENYLRIMKICEDRHSCGLAVPLDEIVSDVERAAIYSLPLPQKSTVLETLHDRSIVSDWRTTVNSCEQRFG
jgi:hypothetical protein